MNAVVLGYFHVPVSHMTGAVSRLGTDLATRQHQDLVVTLGQDGLEASVGNGFYNIPRTLDWSELETMRRGGFTIGSHTKRHVSLPAESPDVIADRFLAARGTK